MDGMTHCEKHNFISFEFCDSNKKNFYIKIHIFCIAGMENIRIFTHYFACYGAFPGATLIPIFF